MSITPTSKANNSEALDMKIFATAIANIVDNEYSPEFDSAKKAQEWLNDPKNYERLANIQVLFLGSKNLTHIPSEIEKLTDIKFLYLNNNNLKELPSSLINLTKLEILDLSGNKSLKSLPFFLSIRNINVFLS
ncbi:MAG: hypothetical protein K1000chlam3_01301 [Chlamydiae bacterium]|nr:hypothetical protein [Chlamydiota bacterium]